MVEQTLTDILEDAAGSAPFERLLASGSARRMFHAAAPAHAFAVAVLARALGGPVLALSADPRASEAMAAGAAAFLGQGRVLRFPAWESLPYEGISPTPSVAG